MESCDERDRFEAERFLFISGKPGSGKSEVLVHAAVAVASKGCEVLILCPTGALVHSYRDRLPETEHIVVETIHSGFKIFRIMTNWWSTRPQQDSAG